MSKIGLHIHGLNAKSIQNYLAKEMSILFSTVMFIVHACSTSHTDEE